MLFIGPVLIRGLAGLGRRAPIALRLALRDLARYQARSAAALGAISLALAPSRRRSPISAAAAVRAAREPNLAEQPDRRLAAARTTAPHRAEGSAPISEPTAAELQSLKARVDVLAASLHASAVIPISEAVDQTSTAASAAGTLPDDTATLGNLTTVTHGAQTGIKISGDTPLYVATPTLLAHYGISASAINPNTDVITGRTDLAGFAIIAPQSAVPVVQCVAVRSAAPVGRPAGPGIDGAPRPRPLATDDPDRAASEDIPRLPTRCSLRMRSRSSG